MRFSLSAWALMVLAVMSASGQACPKSSETGPNAPSEVRTLEGQVVFHDGIRAFFELRLDEPQCGHASIQLVQISRAGSPLEVFRGCRVRSRGALDFAPTGYYSLDMYQDAQVIEPLANCKRQLPFPDYSKTKPDQAIREYRVDMHVNYEPGDHPVVFRVTSAGKELRPWQVYARYWLTGGFVLYGICADGFLVDQVFGTPEAILDLGLGSPDDMAAFDPETAATAGKTDLRLGYTCVRNR